jgi:hypothetical protein
MTEIAQPRAGDLFRPFSFALKKYDILGSR